MLKFLKSPYIIAMVVLSIIFIYGVYQKKDVQAFKPENNTTINIENTNKEEMRAIWVPFFCLNMKGTNFTEEEFKQKFDQIINTAKKNKMNALIVHVRSFADALYPSKIFPWSHLVSKEQGKSPGYDPLKYMVESTHKAGLAFHAWVNPFRIEVNNEPKVLADSNIYNIWHNNPDKNLSENVKDFNGKFLNPASQEVQKLIVAGIKELIEDYPVDGIHLDDRLYPEKITEDFDKESYTAYLNFILPNQTALNLEDWRKNNINNLVKEIYSTIKKTNQNIIFGISPAANTKVSSSLGADLNTWCKTPGYIDYIAPQIYFSLEHPVLPFSKSLSEWKEIVDEKMVKLYLGLGVYKAGTEADSGTWKKSSDILMQEINYARNKGCDGFMFFSVADFMQNNAPEEIANVIKVLN